MTKQIAVFFLAFILISSASADEWTREDTYRETAVIALHTVDWLQTRSAAKDGWRDRYELNALLGKNPTIGELNNHFVLTSLGHIWIAHQLPAEWRKAWQYIVIGDAGSAVVTNYRLGVRVKF